MRNETKRRRRDIAREGNHREDTIQRMQRKKVELIFTESKGRGRRNRRKDRGRSMLRKKNKTN